MENTPKLEGTTEGKKLTLGPSKSESCLRHSTFTRAGDLANNVGRQQ